WDGAGFQEAVRVLFRLSPWPRMSYRAIKRLLGETSLERKCRFLFGGALMVLITGSFYLYAQLNLGVLKDQNRERARLVVSPRLLARHSKNETFAPEFQKMQEELLKLKVGEDLADEYEFELYQVSSNSPEASDRPYDQTGHNAVAKLREME